MDAGRIGRAVALGGAATLLLALSIAGALPRSLEAIGQRGSLAVCAHPNALPYSSKRGSLPGFQIELAEALAERLGVSLARHWVINSFQYRRADCDVVLVAPTMGLPTTSSGKLSRSRTKANYLAGRYAPKTAAA